MGLYIDSYEDGWDAAMHYRKVRLHKLEKVASVARGILHREDIGGYGHEGYEELRKALEALDE